jgi:hypothetical protein
VTLAVTMLLADHAQVAAGKLFINGGGWSVVDASPPPYSIVLLLLVPWDRAGLPMDLRLTLVDEDGGTVRQGADGAEARINARIEVQRPPAHRAGVPLDVPLVIGVPAMRLERSSRYTWLLDVDGVARDDWRLSFSTR